jgi:hypothetical protein
VSLSIRFELLTIPAEAPCRLRVTGMHNARGIAGMATIVSSEDPRMPLSFLWMAWSELVFCS